MREDFAKKRAINFAIRLDGKCIGEVLLYRFDGKGGAEEGCRIAPEYGGQATASKRSAPWPNGDSTSATWDTSSPSASRRTTLLIKCFLPA